MSNTSVYNTETQEKLGFCTGCAELPYKEKEVKSIHKELVKQGVRFKRFYLLPKSQLVRKKRYCLECRKEVARYTKRCYQCFYKVRSMVEMVYVYGTKYRKIQNVL